MEGEVECKTCYGKKFILQYHHSWDGKLKLVGDICPTCDGTGKVLWIDEAMGRNPKRRKRHR